MKGDQVWQDWVYALIITHRGRMDSFDVQEPDTHRIRIFSTMALAQHHAQPYQVRGSGYSTDIISIQVDSPTESIDL